MEKRNEESRATAERIKKARSKSSHKKILGRKNSKLGLLNAIKEKRKIRKLKLTKDKTWEKELQITRQKKQAKH